MVERVERWGYESIYFITYIFTGQIIPFIIIWKAIHIINNVCKLKLDSRRFAYRVGLPLSNPKLSSIMIAIDNKGRVL